MIVSYIANINAKCAIDHFDDFIITCTMKVNRTVILNDHYLTAISISFSQSSYSVNETVGSLQAMLVLSNPSSANITVMVLSDNDTATGKYT